MAPGFLVSATLGARMAATPDQDRPRVRQP